MRPATDVVKRVVQTEKGTRVAAYDQYLVDVDTRANKIEIRDAIETIFNVKVLKVNTQIGHGKWRRLQAHWGRRPDRKRALVTLAKGQKLDMKT